MKVYRVHRALYQQYLTAGVPMFFLIVEIIIAVIFLLSGVYLAMALVIPLHIIVAFLHKEDPYFFYILMDVISLSPERKERRHG